MKLHAPRHLRNRHLLILDAVLLSLSTMLAYVVRFEGLDWGACGYEISETVQGERATHHHIRRRA